MSECKQLFVVACGVLDKLNDQDESPYLAVIASIQNFAEKLTIEQIKKGCVEIPDGNGAVRLLVTRDVEG